MKLLLVLPTTRLVHANWASLTQFRHTWRRLVSISWNGTPHASSTVDLKKSETKKKATFSTYPLWSVRGQSTCGLFLVFMDDYSSWDPYRHLTLSPSTSFSTASRERPTSSNVFSHTLCEVSVLCASSEGFVGRQSWEMNGQTGQSSFFSVSQYSGIWGSVAEKREHLQPSWGENMK